MEFAARTAVWVLMTSLVFTISILLPWMKNIRLARATGLPYIVIPWYSYNRLKGLFMIRVIMPVINAALPKPSAGSWRSVVSARWPWKLLHAPFAELGSDTFLTVAPGGIILNTADADVILQITARGTDFPKASHLYESVNIYGENILATEGDTWRRHRKITSPLFSETNNQLVWAQTLECCESMLDSWTSEPNKVIRTLAEDTRSLSLNVLEHAGLGQNDAWPEWESSTEATAKQQDLPAGHKMTFHAALTALLHNLIFVIVLPTWLLSSIPTKRIKQANQGFREWRQYMEETMSRKRLNMQSEKSSSLRTSDLLSQYVRASEEGAALSLSRSEILGNLFVMIIAGHETSANSIHFCLVLLAMHPAIQREVQEDLDRILPNKRARNTHAKTNPWSYERDFPKLLESKLNAVLNEELRLLPPAIAIPKLSTSVAHVITIQGRQVTIPPNTMMRIAVPSVHRNPNFWSTSASRKDDDDEADSTPAQCHEQLLSDPSLNSHDLEDENDLQEFRPQRWYSSKTPPHQKGAFIPFSDGARACIGRRFAQVEVLVGLARILSEYTVELAVDDHEGDYAGNEVEADSVETKKRLWKHAEERARDTLRNKMVPIITLQLAAGCHVPVKIVKRGEERFANLF